MTASINSRYFVQISRMLKIALLINCLWVGLVIGQFSIQNIQDSYFQDFGTSPSTIGKTTLLFKVGTKTKVFFKVKSMSQQQDQTTQVDSTLTHAMVRMIEK